MNILLTGLNGSTGSELLAQLLARPDIEHITCLTRSPLPAASPKLTTLPHENLTTYPEALADRLATHNALLWTRSGDGEAAIACATAIAERLNHPFRFGYLCNIAADRRTTTLLRQTRIRQREGDTERALQTLTEENPHFRATTFRPARILAKTTSSLVDTLLAPIAIRVDHLALAMIEECTRNQAEHYAVLNNSTLRKIGNPSH